ncbi:uncharacterized protein L203_106460 [Cryptococcus depauperatus CBS 7841]|uniref:Uncharacterized protein n=1 Tax=Cryptococcus depauperatus CBS 7841 TaxID=1295531 RepID=A0AAJ8JZ91_9TREE
MCQEYRMTYPNKTIIFCTSGIEDTARLATSFEYDENGKSIKQPPFKTGICVCTGDQTGWSPKFTRLFLKAREDCGDHFMQIKDFTEAIGERPGKMYVGENPIGEEINDYLNQWNETYIDTGRAAVANIAGRYRYHSGFEDGFLVVSLKPSVFDEVTNLPSVKDRTSECVSTSGLWTGNGQSHVGI